SGPEGARETIPTPARLEGGGTCARTPLSASIYAAVKDVCAPRSAAQATRSGGASACAPRRSSVPLEPRRDLGAQLVAVGADAGATGQRLLGQRRGALRIFVRGLQGPGEMEAGLHGIVRLRGVRGVEAGRGGLEIGEGLRRSSGVDGAAAE